MGAGPGASIITIDHATANAFTFSTATTTEPQFIRGLRITAKQANTGNHIEIGAVVVKLRVDDCYIGGTLTNGNGVKIATADSLVTATSTAFQVAGSASSHITAPATGGAVVIACHFIVPATYSGSCLNLITGGIVAFNLFSNGTATVGALYNCNFGEKTHGGLIIGNIFTNGGGATVNSISAPGVAGMWECGNNYGTTVVLPAFSANAAASTHEGHASETRNVRRYYVASDAATLTINPNLYAVLEVVRSNNGAQTLTLTTPTGPGLHCVVVYNNNQGAGGGTITWAGGINPAAATFAVNANKVTMHYFCSHETAAGNYFWGQYGTLANQTP
jgi:hypothetical protein